MKKLRFFLAMLAAKISSVALKVLGRNASYLPGKIAVKLCPDFIGQLTPPETVIAVTGTNGKTTVSNLITSILLENGYSVTNNSLGSNVQAGIATALLDDSTFSGKPKKKIAVLEVDERSSLRIYPFIKPDYLICNNIMRDSLARNAHTEFISYIINEALPKSTKVVLNADDLICASLGPNNKERVYFGLNIEKTDERSHKYLMDIVYCPKCGAELEAEYLRYSHIGRIHCTGCDYRSPTPDFLLTEIDRNANTFTVCHDDKCETFKLINDNVVNLYNFCGIVALLTSIGLSYQQISAGFDKAKIIQTRYDHFEAGPLTVTMQLSKGQNPTACARCFSYVSKCDGDNKAIIFVGDNFEDSESPCWLFDSDYSSLLHPSISQIIFTGPRSKDQFLRAQIAGVPTDKIQINSDSSAGADMVDLSASRDIYVLYGPYMVKEANLVKSRLIQLGKELEANDG